MKPRVLVVDDEETIRTLMGEFLAREGIDAQFAADGEEGLEKAAALKPDLVILDVMMPRLHGIEVLRRLKADKSTAGIKVIVFSTKDFEADRKTALELGALKVLAKPPKWREFGQVIRETLGMAAAAADAGGGAAATAAEYRPAVSTQRGAVTFWGTRGSVPVSGGAYARHGGNTSCLTFEKGDDLVILDAGTGIRPLGELLAEGKPRRLHLFITHTHWDHIQGFPFFKPAYLPGFEVHIYGAKGFGKDLKQIFQGQLDRDYFPAQLEDMRAALTFHDLAEGPSLAGDVKVTWAYTHHPGAAVAYKLQSNGRSFAYVSDNELLKGYLGAPGEIKAGSEALVPYQSIISFISGVDLLVAEAQYTNEEYKAKIGWGHSSLSNACLLAKLADVKRWLVTHHEPRYADDALERNLILSRQMLEELGAQVDLRHAFDGMREVL